MNPSNTLQLAPNTTEVDQRKELIHSLAVLAIGMRAVKKDIQELLGMFGVQEEEISQVAVSITAEDFHFEKKSKRYPDEFKTAFLDVYDSPIIAATDGLKTRLLNVLEVNSGNPVHWRKNRMKKKGETAPPEAPVAQEVVIEPEVPITQNATEELEESDESTIITPKPVAQNSAIPTTTVQPRTMPQQAPLALFTAGDKKKLATENVDLARKNVDLRRSNQNMQEEIRELNRQLQTAQQQVTDLSQENSRLQKSAQDLPNIRNLQTQIDQLQADNENLRLLKEQVERRLEDLQSANRTWQQRAVPNLQTRKTVIETQATESTHVDAKQKANEPEASMNQLNAAKEKVPLEDPTQSFDPEVWQIIRESIPELQSRIEHSKNETLIVLLRVIESIAAFAALQTSLEQDTEKVPANAEIRDLLDLLEGLDAIIEKEPEWVRLLFHQAQEEMLRNWDFVEQEQIEETQETEESQPPKTVEVPAVVVEQEVEEIAEPQSPIAQVQEPPRERIDLTSIPRPESKSTVSHRSRVRFAATQEEENQLSATEKKRRKAVMEILVRWRIPYTTYPEVIQTVLTKNLKFTLQKIYDGHNRDLDPGQKKLLEEKIPEIAKNVLDKAIPEYMEHVDDFMEGVCSDIEDAVCEFVTTLKTTPSEVTDNNEDTEDNGHIECYDLRVETANRGNGDYQELMDMTIEDFLNLLADGAFATFVKTRVSSRVPNHDRSGRYQRMMQGGKEMLKQLLRNYDKTIHQGLNNYLNSNLDDFFEHNY